jgi:hypothetical protein
VRGWWAVVGQQHLLRISFSSFIFFSIDTKPKILVKKSEGVVGSGAPVMTNTDLIFQFYFSTDHKTLDTGKF